MNSSARMARTEIMAALGMRKPQPEERNVLFPMRVADQLGRACNELRQGQIDRAAARIAAQLDAVPAPAKSYLQHAIARLKPQAQGQAQGQLAPEGEGEWGTTPEGLHGIAEGAVRARRNVGETDRNLGSEGRNRG